MEIDIIIFYNFPSPLGRGLRGGVMSDNTAAAFNAEIDKAFQAAYHAERGGDEGWRTVMQNYGAEPVSQKDRETLLNSEMKIVRGAFPIELRRVYEQIFGKYVAVSGGKAELQSALKSFSMENKVIEYYHKIKPFSGLGDIFKNASTGTAKYSQGLQDAKHLTIKCKSCGAPRLEEMQYDKCMFCGSELFVKNG